VLTVARGNSAGLVAGVVVPVVKLTDAVPAIDPPCCVAVTWKVPAVLPAVKSPTLVIVPPVADQVTDTLAVLPSLMRPDAENCCEAPTTTDAVVGETVIEESVGALAVIVTAEVSALPAPLAMTRNEPEVVPAV
jgi:hypothetical protein